MTVSFNQTADQICKRAMRQIGVIASGETPSADMMNDCYVALNAMTKEWESTGLHLWTETEGMVFLQPGQAQYRLGPDSLDHATTAPFITQAYSALMPEDNALIVLAAGTMAVGDNIGVQMDGLGVFWTAISGVNGQLITLVTPPPYLVSAAQPVYSYPISTKMERPLRILSLRRRFVNSYYNGIGENDVALTPIARLDYQALPYKTQAGTVNQWFYDPQLNNGILNIWQTPTFQNSTVLPITFMRQIQDWSLPGQFGDFPQEWVNAITLNLAIEIAPEYDVNPQKMPYLLQQAQLKKQAVMDWDREPESIYFGCAHTPEYR